MTMTDDEAMTAAVRSGVYEAMPRWDAIRDALTPWTPLPPGSHLRLNDDRRGVQVVAVRSRELTCWDEAQNRFDRCERGEVMTDRGDLITLDAECRLRVGR